MSETRARVGHERSHFAHSTIPEEKWGTTRSLDLDRTKRHYSKHVSPVPWVFVISRFHCKKLEVEFFYTFESVLYPKETFKKNNGV